jgi:hypothetical protein
MTYRLKELLAGLVLGGLGAVAPSAQQTTVAYSSDVVATVLDVDVDSRRALLNADDDSV